MPQITVGTSAVLIVHSDPKRISLTVVNEDPVNVIRVGKDSIDVSNSPPIYPRSSIAFAELYGDNPTLARYIISSAANTTVSYSEEFKP